MASTSWKNREREVAALIKGQRYPANQGGRVDCHSNQYLVQVKERKSLSLEVLTQLVEEVEQLAKAVGKQGLVAVKVRRGSGRSSPMLIVQTATQWKCATDTTKPLAQGS